MSHAQMTFQPESSHSTWRGGRRVLIVGIALALLTAGGWWAYDAGLLDRFWGQATETAAPVTGQSENGEPQGAISAPPSGVDTASTGDLPAIPVMAGAGTSAIEASALPEAATSSETAGSLLPTVTPAPAPISIPAIAGVKGVQLWDGSGNLLTTLDSGALLTATGRSADGAWLAVQTNAGAGWVQTAHVIAYDVQVLPEAMPPAVLVAPEQQATAATMTAGETTAETATAAGTETGSPVETETVKAIVSTAGAQLNVRSGPGTEHPILAKASAGDELVVLGRNAAGDWLQIQWPDSADGFGWVAAQYVQFSGDASVLPVSEVVAAAQALAGGITVSASTSASVVAVAASGQTVAATAASATGLQGTLVFQQSTGGLIYAYNLATGELWPLTYGADPAISPDGSTVAFVRDGGENGLYLIDIDGSSERLIFVERNRMSSPKWSPDGNWIVFSRGDEYSECYDLGRNQCLTEAELNQRFPNGLPADLEAPLIKQYSYKLAVVDASGQNYHDVASLNSAKAPDWSEGGIVYDSAAGLQRTEDAANAVNELVVFDYLKPYYNDPDWQPGPEGALGQIAFQVKGAAQWEIYVVNPDGTGMTALTRPVTTLVDELPSNVTPAYSPDGQQIVFLSNRGEDNSAGAWRLWVMNADGSDQRPLPIDLAIHYTYGLEQVVSWGS